MSEIAWSSSLSGRGAQRARVILEVIGTGEGLHYRIKWNDGHESTFFPRAGRISIIPRATKATAP